jgi:hypothetical protein
MTAFRYRLPTPEEREPRNKIHWDKSPFARLFPLMILWIFACGLVYDYTQSTGWFIAAIIIGQIPFGIAIEVMRRRQRNKT